MQPLQIIISGNTAEEVKTKYVEMGKALGLTLSSNQATSAPAQSEPTPAADPAPAAETKAAKGKKAKDAEPAPVANIFGDAPAAATSAVPTKDEVRAALTDVNGTKGTPAAMEILKEFGAANMSGLKETDYAAFVAKCKEVVAAK